MNDSCPQSAVLEREQEQQLTEHILSCDDIIKKILIHRYGLFDTPPKSLQETGKAMRLSAERVRQLQKRVKSVSEKNLLRQVNLNLLPNIALHGHQYVYISPRLTDVSSSR
ncbi:sigma factor-like helix-turn-helix DNA-binding protein [Vibrio owensii]|uniref:sigma factor-like helix-turn-helix DNA-binding protein n=1 Tax=Vibrio owensii TaxID=696485 RepID=UPI0012D3B8A0